MGVFAWFRRKGEKGEQSAEAVGDAPAAGTTPTADPQEPAAAPSGVTGSGERSEEPAAEAGSGQDAREEREEAEGVEIPKQQAADEAADREAGEGARA
ncbi:hypothetical protein SUDANB38_04557 [Streptomyces sp. enrichment culture]